ncbi:lipid-A-disaccharide synthase [Hylemonella gracilis str. Niagara R]|uniref:Lipid-A-disaccharide synthase n=1 Tax=Hylemonella gracilis str. Niagara R TaxID=1458275 RepID=A0A016XGQ8_9BURK|nr:lipid-A-disaccharide synthase [Hylemonella gracilis]EYC51016.1 lipid-A-disaccharide synthase [Hylemonella gracilis str. Niagara R]
MVAGEASGDLLAGLLLDGLQARWPQVRKQGSMVGIGGPQMLRRGFEAWWPSEKLAVSGYVEVLRRYRELVGIRDQLRQRLLRERPDVFIGVDAPDFNLDLERSLREAGIKTAHFVCPSVWAWRPERVHKIKTSVDHVLCIFPFEVELLAQHGIAATYVGHPLANVIPRVPDRAAARAVLGLPDDAPVVAVLPGSRASEVKHLAARFLQAAALMHQVRPDLHIVVPAAPGRRAAIEQVARQVFGGRGIENCHILDGKSHQALAACDVTLIASGTATLEAALYKRPMVIAYAVHWLTAWIMRGKKLQPWIGLPNILCRDFVVPELLQEEAQPEQLAAATLAWLDDPARVAALQARFDALHAELQRDTPTLAADAIAQILPA